MKEKKNKDEGERLALEIYLKETLHNHKINSQKKKGRKKDKKMTEDYHKNSESKETADLYTDYCIYFS